MKVVLLFIFGLLTLATVNCQAVQSFNLKREKIFYSYKATTDKNTIKLARSMNGKVLTITFNENLFGDGFNVRKSKVGKQREIATEQLLQIVSQDKVFEHAIVNVFNNELTIIANTSLTEFQEIIDYCLKQIETLFKIELILSQTPTLQALVFLYKANFFIYTLIRNKPILWLSP